MSRVPPNVTLTPGRAATLITEYAGGDDDPIRIISPNPGAPRVYLGTDSGVSPLTGVPLDGGTSLPWTNPGQLWAVADPAAAAATSLTITTLVEDWQPSPAAIATQTAQQLLAGGVPNVLKQDTLFIGTVPAAPGTVTIDVSGYSTASILFTQPANPMVDISIAQQVTGSAPYYVSSERYALSSNNRAPITFEVVGGTLVITNNVAAPAQIRVVGSNRNVPTRMDVRSNVGRIDQWSLAQPAAGINVVAGTQYPMLQYDPTAQLQGLCFAAFRYGAGTTAAGHWVIQTPEGLQASLCDSTEMIVANLPGTGQKVASKLIALPASTYTVIFYCGTSGVANAFCQFIQAAL